MSETVETETLEVSLKAFRKPKFKAGSELSGKVNRVELVVDHTENDDNEVLDIDLKWEVEADV